VLALEQERWAAPLADQIREALNQRLAAALSAPGPAWSLQSRWRIVVDVTRFDSQWGQRADLDAGWSIESAGMPTLRCQSRFESPAGASFAALLAAHRHNVDRLGDALAAALQRLGAAPAGGSAACR
jgi:uncharacterized lipoprotein YmbA